MFCWYLGAGKIMLVSGTTARTRRKATGTRSFVSNRAPDMNQLVQPAEKVFLIQEDKKTNTQRGKSQDMTTPANIWTQ